MRKFIEGMLRKRAEAATAEFRDHRRQVRSKAPALRVELVAATDSSWLSAPGVQQVVREPGDMGFQPAGVLAVKGNENAVMAGFVSPRQGAYASIPKSGERAFVSFTSHFSDGSVFEYSNLPVPFEPPCPDWLVRQRRVGASPRVLWSGFLEERPGKDLTDSSVAGFAASSTDDFSSGIRRGWPSGAGRRMRSKRNPTSGGDRRPDRAALPGSIERRRTAPAVARDRPRAAVQRPADRDEGGLDGACFRR